MNEFKKNWLEMNKQEIPDKVYDQYNQASHESRYGETKQDRQEALETVKILRQKYTGIEKS